jgi:hypothetical protein
LASQEPINEIDGQVEGFRHQFELQMHLVRAIIVQCEVSNMPTTTTDYTRIVCAKNIYIWDPPRSANQWGLLAFSHWCHIDETYNPLAHSFASTPRFNCENAWSIEVV